MQKKTYDAIILLSGGQDSTTCLYWAKQRFNRILAIIFDYGQSHIKEIEFAKKNAKNACVDYRLIELHNIFGVSSLTDNNIAHSSESAINSELPASFLVGRNLLFLSVAASLCGDANCKNIVVGVCQTDYSGYPDCRRATIDAMQLAFSLGLGLGDIQIHTPLMYLTKAETWKMAKSLNILDVIIKNTMTDYSGSEMLNEWGFGDLENPASLLRMKGFYDAKLKGWI